MSDEPDIEPETAKKIFTENVHKIPPQHLTENGFRYDACVGIGGYYNIMYFTIIIAIPEYTRVTFVVVECVCACVCPPVIVYTSVQKIQLCSANNVSVCIRVHVYETWM